MHKASGALSIVTFKHRAHVIALTTADSDTTAVHWR
jgi:hypothetical protein